MATNRRTIATVPDEVWKVLSDGWLLPLWVVGASRMRDVDATWPAVGSKVHHSFGVWPALVDDETEVLEMLPGHLLRLRPKGWPIGEAEVLITLTAKGSDTLVEITEDAVSGPGKLVPSLLRTPAIFVRNIEALRRLAFVAEGRQQG